MTDDLPSLLARLTPLDPPVYVMGGIAEDLLLGGQLSHAYSDVDVLVSRPDLGLRHRQFAQSGLGPLEKQLQNAAGQPLALFAVVGGLIVDLWVTDGSEANGLTLELPGAQSNQRFRLTLPADTFSHPPIEFAGGRLHTVSPLALAQLRATSARTRHSGDKQARDLAQLSKLQAAFGLAARAIEPALIELKP